MAIISQIKDDEHNKSATALEIDSVAAAVLVDADGKIIDVKSTKLRQSLTLQRTTAMYPTSEQSLIRKKTTE